MYKKSIPSQVVNSFQPKFTNTEDVDRGLEKEISYMEFNLIRKDYEKFYLI